MRTSYRFRRRGIFPENVGLVAAWAFFSEKRDHMATEAMFQENIVTFSLPGQCYRFCNSVAAEAIFQEPSFEILFPIA